MSLSKYLLQEDFVKQLAHNWHTTSVTGLFSALIVFDKQLTTYQVIR